MFIVVVDNECINLSHMRSAVFIPKKDTVPQSSARLDIVFMHSERIMPFHGDDAEKLWAVITDNAISVIHEGVLYS